MGKIQKENLSLNEKQTNNENKKRDIKNKKIKSIAFRVALVFFVVLAITVSAASTTAIFVSNTQVTETVSFADLSLNAEVYASNIKRTNSRNIKYISNYFNDEDADVVTSATVSTSEGGYEAYIRVEAQYAFENIADSSLTDNLKIVLTNLNLGSITPYVTSSYKWLLYDDGYYYLVNSSNSPLSVSAGSSYTFISSLNPIKYNAISSLNLKFSDVEEEVMNNLGLVLNFECVQAVEQYASILSLKNSVGEFDSSTSQAREFGNIVVFNTNSGDYLDTIITSNSSVNLATYIPTKAGCTFSAWQYNSTPISTVNFSSSSKIVKVYAVYTENTYNITYKDMNDSEYSGSAITSPTTYTFGTETTLPTTGITRTGYSFLGWYSDADCVNAITSISDATFGDIIVYAKWTPNKYSIIYGGMANAVFVGDKINDYAYASNQIISLPTAFKDGYVFDGWYTGANGTGTKLTTLNTANSSSDITIYANFIAQSYTIKFNANGGNIVSPIADIQYTSNQNFTLYSSAVVEKEHYKLLGWEATNVDQNSNWNLGAIYLPNAQYSQNPINYLYGDVTLSACWQLDLESITLKLYDNSVEKQDYTVTDGEDVLLAENYNITTDVIDSNADLTSMVANDNKIFLGWSLSNLATTASYVNVYQVEPEHISSDEISLYAVWSNVSYYAITNDGVSSYSVYGVDANGNSVYLFSASTLQYAISGIDKYANTSNINLHFGSDMSQNAVCGTLSIATDTVSFSGLTATTFNFVKGLIQSTKTASTSSASTLNENEAIFQNVSGKTLNLNSSTSELKIYSSCCMFSNNGGTINVLGGYYQVGTSTSAVSNENPIIFNLSGGVVNISGGNFITYYNTQSGENTAIENNASTLVVAGGYFDNVFGGSAIYTLNAASFSVANASFISNSSKNSLYSGECIRIGAGASSANTITSGSFYAYVNNCAVFVVGSLTINGGNFEAQKTVITGSGVPSIIISDGQFTTTYPFAETNDIGVVVIAGGYLTISGGNFVALSRTISSTTYSTVGIYASNTSSITISNANITSSVNKSIYIGNNATTLTISNSSINSSEEHALYCAGSGAVQITSSIISSSGNCPTIEFTSSGSLTINDGSKIYNNNLNGSSATAITMQGSASLLVQSTLSALDVSGSSIVISASSLGAGSHAINHNSVGTITTSSTEALNLVVISNSSYALYLHSNTTKNINGGEFMSEQNYAVFVNACSVNFGGSVIVTKNIADYAEHSLGKTTTSIHSALYVTGTSSVFISENAQIKGYNAPAIIVDGGTLYATTLTIGGSAQISAEANTAIRFNQSGSGALLTIYGTPTISSVSEAYTDVEFLELSTISAKQSSTSYTGNVISLKYIGLSTLAINNIIVTNVETASSNKFTIVNDGYNLSYKPSPKTLVLGQNVYVSYDGNGGTCTITDNTTYNPGDTVTVQFFPIPSRIGYMFLGWATNKYAIVVDYSSTGTTTFTMGTNNVTLYAIWRVNAVELYFGTVSSANLYGAYASFDEAMQAYNSASTSQTTATLKLLRSSASTQVAYVLAGSDVANCTTNYSRVSNSNAKTLTITASNSNAVLNLYSSGGTSARYSSSFVVGSGYTLIFDNITIDGNAGSLVRLSTARLANIVSGGTITINNATIMNFKHFSTANANANGGVFYNEGGTVNVWGTSLIQNCEIEYGGTQTSSNNDNAGWVAGSVLYMTTGTANFGRNVKIVSCCTTYSGSFNSGSYTGYIDIYGAIFVNGLGTVNFNGEMSNCDVNVKNSHKYDEYTINADRDKIYVRGAGIGVNGGATANIGIANVGNETGTLSPKIQNCSADVSTHTAYILGVALYANTSTSKLNVLNTSIINCDGGLNNFYRGQIQGAGAYVNAATAVFTSCTIRDNDASDGQMYNYRGSLTIHGGEISSTSGTAILIYANSNANMRLNIDNNATLTNNGKPTNAYGIYIGGTSTGEVNISNSTINCYGNECLRIGDGNNNNQTVVNISSSTLENKNAGYAIAHYGKELLSVTNSTLKSKTAAALRIGYNAGSISNATISGGTVQSDGADCIYSRGAGNATNPGLTLTGGVTVNTNNKNYYAINLDGGTGSEFTDRTSLRVVNATITTANKRAINVNNVGKVKVEGGTIKSNGKVETIYFNGGDSAHRTAVRFEMTGGTITNDHTDASSSSWVNGKALTTNSNFYGILNISGGTISVTGYGGAMQLSAVETTDTNESNRKAFTNANAVCNISGSAIIRNTSSHAIIATSIPLNVTGGTISSGGAGWGVWLNGGYSYMVMSGGTVSSNSGTAIKVWKQYSPKATNMAAYISGGAVTAGGCAIHVDKTLQNDVYYTGAVKTIQITGGTLTSSANDAIKVSGATASNVKDVLNIIISGNPTISSTNNIAITKEGTCQSTISISGGAITGKTGGISLNGSGVVGDNVVNISGGTISATNGDCIINSCLSSRVNISNGIISTSKEANNNNVYFAYNSTIDNLLSLSGTPQLRNTSNAYKIVRTTTTNSISAQISAVNYTGNIIYTTFAIANPVEGNIVVINASNTTSPKFALEEPAGFYLNLSSTNLVLAKTVYKLLFNRNFMMAVGSSNLGDFGHTGEAYTTTYGYATNSAFVEGYTNYQYNTPTALTTNGFARTGYNFAGWTFEQNNSSLTPNYSNEISVTITEERINNDAYKSLKINNNEVSPTTRTDADCAYNAKEYVLRLYAKWSEETYTITYNLNGGKINNATTIANTTGKKYGNTITLPTAPVMANHNFVGWAETMQIGGKYYTRIFYHDPFNTTGAISFNAFPAKTDTYQSLPNTNSDVYRFSMVNDTENIRQSIASGSAGAYTYYMQFHNYFDANGNPAVLNWSQTSNPTTTQESVTGKTIISATVSTGAFRGLALSNSGSTYLDAVETTSHWHYAIGATQRHYNGIPEAGLAYFGTAGNRTTFANSTSFPVSLWQQIGNGSAEDLSNIYRTVSGSSIGMSAGSTYYVKGNVTLTALYEITNYQVYFGASNSDDLGTLALNTRVYQEVVNLVQNPTSSSIYANNTKATIKVCRSITETAPNAIEFNGANGSLTRLDLLGNGESTVWTIPYTGNLFVLGKSNKSTSPTMNVSNITIDQGRTGGSSDVDAGRFIHIYGNATLNIKPNTKFQHYSLDSTWSHIIWCGESAICNITGGTFQNNYSARKGTIITGSTSSIITISDGTFQNNATVDGGVVCLAGGTLNILGGTFNKNTATNGAVVCVSSGTCNISGGIFGGDGAVANANVATTYGGVLHQAGGIVNITGGTFGKASTKATSSAYANTAAYGGALTNIAGTMTISGSAIIAGNYASNWGGGILNDPSGALNLNGGSMYGNYAATGGGGAHFKGTVSINGMVIGNDSYPNYSPRGGAFATLAGTTTLTSGTIGSTATSLATSSNCANYSTGCAGAIDAYGGNFIMQGGVIGHNYASTHGGAIRSNKTCTISNGDIQYNYAASANDGQGGGGIILCEASVLTVSGTASIHHNATARSGGAIHLWSNCSATSSITGGSIYSNTANSKGGAINIEAGTLNISGGTIGDSTTTTATNASYSNKAVNGGGIYQRNGTLNIYGSPIIGRNFATSSGGGIFINAGTINFKNGASGTTNFTGHIQYNASAGNGGGIVSSVATTLASGHIHHNKAGQTDGTVASVNSAHGGGLYLGGGSTRTYTLTGDVEINNNTSYRAGGVASPNVTLNINSANVKVHDNNAASIGGGLGSWNIGTINLSAGKIYSNTASSGGGVWCQSESVLNLSGTAEIYSNTATSGGGGGVFLEIWANAQGMPNMNMSGGKIYGNTATTNGGGILFGNYKNSSSVVVYSTLTITGGVIGDDTKTTTATATAGQYSNKANNGGGIYCQGGILNITNGKIAYNYAVNSGGGIYLCKNNSVNGLITLGGTNHIQYNYAVNYGGGIYVADSIYLTLNSSMKIHHNNTQRGGGIYASGGNLVLDGCEIYNNNATAHGGGGYLNATTVQGSTSVHNNTTTGNGGGLLFNNNATITSGSFVGNIAGGIGGAVNFNTSASTITGGTFGVANTKATTSACSNKAANGGAISNEGTGTLTINNANVVIADNYATSQGGGVYNQTTGTITLTACSIYGNIAPSGGGVFLANGTVNLSGATIGNDSYPNEATATSGIQGGGVGMNGGTFNLNSGVIGSTATSYATSSSRANYCKDGAGIDAYGGTLNIKGGTIGHNYSSANSGGIRCCTTLNISGGTIQYNANRGVCMHNGSAAVSITGGTISNNYCGSGISSGTGGAGLQLWSGYTGTVTMSSGTITANTSTNLGGGIGSNGNAILNISGGNIYSNTAVSGGGMYIVAGTVTMSGGNIYNHSTTNGGGIYQAGGTININNANAKIYTNTASSYGGGIYQADGTINLSAGYIGKSDATAMAGTSQYSNKAQWGGGVYQNAGTFNLSGTGTIIYNYASVGTNNATDNYLGGGGGMFIRGTLSMTGGNVCYNYGTGTAGGIYLASKSDNSANSSTISGGNIYSNYSTSDGGGVYVGALHTLAFSGGCIGKSSATAVADDSNFSNYAPNGAGIYSSGTINMSGSANIMYNRAYWCGGGIYLIYRNVFGATTSGMTMTGGNIKYNFVHATRATSDTTSNRNAAGGGIHMTGAATTLSISGGSISYNKVKAERTLNSTMTNDAQIDANGGAICSYATTSASSISISGSTSITYNATESILTTQSTYAMTSQARCYGSAISVNSGPALTLGGSVAITNNTASATHTYNGSTSGKTGTAYCFGAVKFNTSLTMSSTVSISDNAMTSTATGTTSCAVTARCHGGGICSYGTLTINGGTISNNTQTSTTNATGTGDSTTYNYGGGVYNNSTGTLTIKGGTISNNTQTGTSNALTGATTTGNYGTGLHTDKSGGTLTMSGGTITGNKAYTYSYNTGINGTNSTTTRVYAQGGGMYISNQVVNMSGGTISNNDITTWASTRVVSGVVKNNVTSALTVEGGGIFLIGATGAKTLYGFTLSGNKAIGRGGGIYVVNTDATIGSSSKTTTITGNQVTTGSGSGLDIYLGTASTTCTIEVTRVTFTSNTANSGYGGAVCVSPKDAEGIGLNVTLTNCTIGVANTVATSSAYSNRARYGGAIQVAYNSTVTLVNTTVADNYASTDGGAIHIHSAGSVLNINSGTIYGNNSPTGGAIYQATGTLNMSGGTISANTATNGAGLYQNAGTSTLSGGTIGNVSNPNIATSAGGGAFINTSATMNLQGAVIGATTSSVATSSSRANQAQWGAGIECFGILNMTSGTIGRNYSTSDSCGIRVLSDNASNTNVVTLSGGNIQYNTATGDGGGVMVCRYGALVISGANIHHNKTSGNGGGVKVWSDCKNTTNLPLTITRGNIYNNSAVNGGGVYIDVNGANGGVVLMSGGSIYSNTATTNGGGIYNVSSKSMTISGTTYTGLTICPSTLNAFVTVRDNSATDNGGGIYNSGIVTMKGGQTTGKCAEINNNRATNGGGIYHASGTLTIIDPTLTELSRGSVTFNSNTADNGYGGAIYHASGTTSIGVPTTALIGCNVAFSSNSAYSGGGAIYQASGTLTISQRSGSSYITFSQNHAYESSGGAMLLSNGTLNLTGVECNENEADMSGGAIYQNDGMLSLNDVSFTSNYANGTTASAGGGAIYNAGGTITMSSGIIEQNSASSRKGNGIYLTSSNLNITGTNVYLIDKTYLPSGIIIDCSTLPTGSTLDGRIYVQNVGDVPETNIAKFIDNATASSNKARFSIDSGYLYTNGVYEKVASIYKITYGDYSECIYEVYGVGYSRNSSGSSPGVTVVPIPSVPTGHYYWGSYTGNAGTGTQCINRNGEILVSNTTFTSNTTLYLLSYSTASVFVNFFNENSSVYRQRTYTVANNIIVSTDTRFITVAECGSGYSKPSGAIAKWVSESGNKYDEDWAVTASWVTTNAPLNNGVVNLGIRYYTTTAIIIFDYQSDNSLDGDGYRVGLNGGGRTNNVGRIDVSIYDTVNVYAESPSQYANVSFNTGTSKVEWSGHYSFWGGDAFDHGGVQTGDWPKKNYEWASIDFRLSDFVNMFPYGDNTIIVRIDFDM